MDGISCVGIFHAQRNRRGAFFPGTEIETDLKGREVIAGNLAVIDIRFQFRFFTRVKLGDDQFGIKLTVRRRKSRVFNIDIKNSCVISKGMEIQSGFFHDITVPQVGTDIVISGAAGKYIVTGTGGVLPFVEHISMEIEFLFVHFPNRLFEP